MITREQILKIYTHLKLPYKEYLDKHTIQVNNPAIQDTKFHMGLCYNEKQCYNCFKTNESGRLNNFLYKLLKKYNTDSSTIKYLLASKADSSTSIIVPQSVPVWNGIAPVIALPESTYQIDPYATSLTNRIFTTYLSKRGITAEMIVRYKLHCNISNRLYGHRVIIPYYERDKIVFWIARDITNKAKQKYLYPKGTEKAHFVYNLENNLTKKQLIICEGQFNAMIIDGIAVGGSKISDTQLKLITQCTAKTVYIAFDQDKPGITGMMKSCETLKQYFKNIHYFKLTQLTKEDFCDWGSEKSLELLYSNCRQYNQLSIIQELIALN